jgi:hypothetical protein
MYLQRKKSTLYLYSKYAFCSETETRLIFCTRDTSLGAKSGLSDEFSQKIKTTFLGHEYFLLFKLSFFTDTVADLAVRYTLCGLYFVRPV